VARVFERKATDKGLTLELYRGEGLALLAFDVDPGAISRSTRWRGGEEENGGHRILGLFLYYPGHAQVPSALRAFIDVIQETHAAHETVAVGPRSRRPKTAP
jgi:hypothetical protein